MQSPFPGMDPYLEDPEIWPDAHLRLLSEISNSLNRVVRPKYFTRVETRVYVSDDNDPGRAERIPDLKLLRYPKTLPPSEASRTGGRALVQSPFVLVTPALDEEVAEHLLEVIDKATGSVVAVLELLSPTNKVPGAASRGSFIAKRKQVLASSSHWLEIDLLRKGLQTFFRPTPYGVSCSRTEQRPSCREWYFGLEDPIPVVGVPLKDGDPDALLDLRAVLDTVYENAAYELSIDYRREPVPPLDAAQAAWADALLREKGLR